VTTSTLKKDRYNSLGADNGRGGWSGGYRKWAWAVILAVWGENKSRQYFLRTGPYLTKRKRLEGGEIREQKLWSRGKGGVRLL